MMIKGLVRVVLCSVLVLHNVHANTNSSNVVNQTNQTKPTVLGSAAQNNVADKSSNTNNISTDTNSTKSLNKDSDRRLKYEAIISEYKQYESTVDKKTKDAVSNFRKDMKSIDQNKKDLYKSLSQQAQAFLKVQHKYKKQLPINQKKEINTKAGNASPALQTANSAVQTKTQSIILEYRKYLSKVDKATISEIERYRKEMAFISEKKKALYKLLTPEVQLFLEKQKEYKKKLPINKKKQINIIS